LLEFTSTREEESGIYGDSQPVLPFEQLV